MKFIKCVMLLLSFFIISHSVHAANVDEDQSQIRAYYFHTSSRCPSCIKIEKYTDTAITSGFSKELDSKELIWKSINIEEKENKEFIEKYSLFSQTLILSKVINGKEGEWKNLDKVWHLVGDEEAFITYVQKEIESFRSTQKEQE